VTALFICGSIQLHDSSFQHVSHVNIVVKALRGKQRIRMDVGAKGGRRRNWWLIDNQDKTLAQTEARSMMI